MSFLELSLFALLPPKELFHCMSILFFSQVFSISDLRAANGSTPKLPSSSIMSAYMLSSVALLSMREGSSSLSFLPSINDSNSSNLIRILAVHSHTDLKFASTYSISRSLISKVSGSGLSSSFSSSSSSSSSVSSSSVSVSFWVSLS